MKRWKTQKPWVQGLIGVAGLWLVGAIVDRLWFAIDRSVPGWDQADYLTGALNYWRALQTAQVFSGEWWIELWQLSTKIPPLVYISTAPFLSLFGAGPDQSTLINLFYSAILLGSVYTLGYSLFSITTGLWAAGLCLLLPGLAMVRLDYLLDYPLAAMVTLCFTCLTCWRGARLQRMERSSRGQYHVWLLAIATGITLGLAFMVKQTSLFFLLVPLLWTLVEAWKRRDWPGIGQWGLIILTALPVFYPWYRTNWLLIITSGKRATVDSAIGEGDPPLSSLQAWTYYLQLLPAMVSWPMLLVSGWGWLSCGWRSWRGSRQDSRRDMMPKLQPDQSDQPQLINTDRRSLIWLLGFWVGGYLLSSLNINKDSRYVVPYLPVLAVLLAYGLTALPRSWRGVRWGGIGLTAVLLIANLFPIAPDAMRQQWWSLPYGHYAYIGAPFPHAQVAATVVAAEPYLRTTVGVLPSTFVVNQHNINYYGQLQRGQIYARQVGTRNQFVEPDARAFSWFITKTFAPGAMPQSAAKITLQQRIEQSDNFQLQQTWQLPDQDILKLWRQSVPPFAVQPLTSTPAESTPALATTTPVRLVQVSVPAAAPPGQPVPVTYQWVGNWEALKSGLVMLTWQQADPSPNRPIGRWLHDHAIAMGNLATHRSDVQSTTAFQVTERLAMLPPDTLPAGTYRLEATYLNRQTGETAPIAVPAVTLNISPQAPPTPAPELDLVTQLRNLAAGIPQGMKAMAYTFEQTGRVSLYDPDQDYVTQARQATEYRLQQEPNNRVLAYTLALANILKKRVDPAIASLQRVVELDPQNPYAYAYLAFANLYDFRPGAAQSALNTAMSLDHTIPELYALRAIAGLMRGNLVQAWQDGHTYQRQLSAKS